MKGFVMKICLILVTVFLMATTVPAEMLFRETVLQCSTNRVTMTTEEDTTYYWYKDIFPGNPEFGVETNYICYYHSVEEIDPPLLPDGLIKSASLKISLRNNNQEDITLTIDSLDIENFVRRIFLVGPGEEYIRVEDSPLRDGRIEIVLSNPDETFTVYSSAFYISYTPAIPLGVEDGCFSAPVAYSLDGNYPNPFNPATTIEYSVPVRSHVGISVYNLLGQEIRTLVNDELPAGIHSVEWDGTDNNGSAVATGMYLYRITAGSYSETKKMVLLK